MARELAEKAAAIEATAQRRDEPRDRGRRGQSSRESTRSQPRSNSNGVPCGPQKAAGDASDGLERKKAERQAEE